MRQPRPGTAFAEASGVPWNDIGKDVVVRVTELGALVDRALGAAVARQGEVLGLVERFLARVADEPDARVRRDLLEELAHLFERELADPERALTTLLEAYREAPSRDLWWELERLAGATGRHADLAAELEVAIPELPAADRAEAWTRLGTLLADRVGAVDEALAAFAAAIAGEPDHRDAHERRVELLRRAERWAELNTALAALADRESAKAAARRHLERAAVLERQGDVPGAMGAYREALAADPGAAAARLALEVDARRRGDHAELARLLEERVADPELDADEQLAVRRELAELAARRGDRAAALAAWEAVRAAAPGDLDALRALERLYQEDGRVRDQIEVLAAQVGLVADVRERAALCRRLAPLWAERLGASSEAEECLEWLLAYEGGSDDTFRTLARMYRADGRARAAIDVMTRHAAATSDPGARAGLYADIAQIYEAEINDGLRAIEYWEKAEADLADPKPARRALARLYARHETLDLDRAAATLERALAAGADDFATRLALARVRRLAHQHGRAAALLGEALPLAPGPAERAAALVELARVHEHQDEHPRALAVCREALALDPDLAEARELEADLLWDARRFSELLPLCERLARAATNDRVRRGWWRRLARAANAVGVAVGAAAPALAELAADVGAPAEDRVEALCQLGLVALGEGRTGEARTQLAAAAALAPRHRRTRLALVELDGCAPAALAHLDGVELEPADHKILHRILDACEAAQAWDTALQVLARLIELERSPVTRARYRHAAGAICHEELGRHDVALAHFEAALDDDAGLERAVAAVEAMLREKRDPSTLLAFYMRQLQRLGPECGDGRKAERLRLWGAVADLCFDELDDKESGMTALEVAVELDGRQVERRARLAALHAEAGADGRERAIAEHQAILRLDRERVGSYRALAELYAGAGRLDRAQACVRAADLIAGVAVAEEVAPPPVRPLTPELWARLRHPDEDRLLDVLFAAVTPALAAASPHSAQRTVPLRRGTVPPNDARPCARALARVASVFAVSPPSALAQPGLAVPAGFQLRVAGRHLVPDVVFGGPLLDAAREIDAIADLALVLAHLRQERFARVIAHDTGDLARIVDAAVAIAGETGAGGKTGATVQLLERTLSPVALDQVATVGKRLAERGLGGEAAAKGWLRATDKTAARAALIISDVATVWRRMRLAGADRERLVDMAWSSVCDEVHAVRAALTERSAMSVGIEVVATPPTAVAGRRRATG
jgi:tetratricopeptide (TPR) repeat protein